MVTSMDWSDQHPELILASYNRATEESSTDPNGLVLLWNTKLQKTTPEYILQAQVIGREIPYQLRKSPSNVASRELLEQNRRNPTIFGVPLAMEKSCITHIA